MTTTDQTAARIQSLELRVIKLRAERDTLRRELEAAKSGIDKDGDYLDGVALGMNIQFVGEKVAAEQAWRQTT